MGNTMVLTVKREDGTLLGRNITVDASPEEVKIDAARDALWELAKYHGGGMLTAYMPGGEKLVSAGFEYHDE